MKFKFNLSKKQFIWLVLPVFAVLIGLGIILFYLNQQQRVSVFTKGQPWFGSYVDVTASPAFAFDQVNSASNRNFVLSFIVSTDQDPCIPNWGTYYTLDKADSSLRLKERISNLRQHDGDVAISFGGLSNQELAVKCTDKAKLKTAYKEVIEHYGIDTIDIDLENDGLDDQQAAARRASALADLQSEMKATNQNLTIWLTLPITPNGLTTASTKAVAQSLQNKVELAGINIMAMNFGDESRDFASLGLAAQNALDQTHKQLGDLYRQTGITLSSSEIWSKIGVTPMIGQNDIANEVFSLDDAKAVNKFALQNKLGRVSMWSANRDTACDSKQSKLKTALTACSGVNQNQHEFAQTLGSGF